MTMPIPFPSWDTIIGLAKSLIGYIDKKNIEKYPFKKFVKKIEKKLHIKLSAEYKENLYQTLDENGRIVVISKPINEV